jgi:hypothetical protein
MWGACARYVTRRFQNIPRHSAGLPMRTDNSLAPTTRKPLWHKGADVAELVDALDLGNSATFRFPLTSDILSLARRPLVALACLAARKDP